VSCKRGGSVYRPSRWGSLLANADKLKAYMKWVATDLPPIGRDDKTGWGIEYIRNILTKSPKDMGGITPPPPPPPPVDTIPVKPLRTLTFNIEKDYSIIWASTATVKAKSRRMMSVKSAAYKPIKITELAVSYQSKTDAVNSERLVKGTIDWFFVSRGLQLPSGSDEADALKWTAYFLNMLAKVERKVELHVLKIGTDSGLYIDNPK